VAISALSLLSWVIDSNSQLAGAAPALAGLLHLVRLGRWAGDRTWRERLLLILHVGYAFVPLGFLLNAAAAFELVPAGAGIHAWMAGGAGIMTLAVMSRATLGHTGQRLTASFTTQLIYAAIIAAAVRGFARQSIHRITGRCCILPPSPGLQLSWISRSVLAGCSPAEADECITAFVQLFDCRRIGAVFLIVLSGGAFVEIVVASGLLPT
jgi:hypothetical protein